MLRALLQQVVLNLLTIIDISLFLVYDLSFCIALYTTATTHIYLKTKA